MNAARRAQARDLAITGLLAAALTALVCLCAVLR